MVRTPVTQWRQSRKASVHLTTGKAFVAFGVSGSLPPFLSSEAFHCSEKFLHDRCPLKISSSGVSTNSVAAANKFRGIRQTLLLRSKCKRWRWNHHICRSCRVGIRHPAYRASQVSSDNLLDSVFIKIRWVVHVGNSFLSDLKTVASGMPI